MSLSKPWLANKKWADNRILSNSKTGMILSWVFTLIWNLLTLPAMLDVGDLIGKIEREPEVLLVFLFPIVGLVLIVVSIKLTQSWLRFGPSPLILSPFPASIGGHAGGEINLKLAYAPESQFQVRLSCLESYISGSGKDKSRKERIEWQTEGVCQNEPGQDGTKITFRFDLPDNLPESEPKTNGRYHLWRLHVSAELPGADFERNFTIPVYRTGGQISTIHQATETHPDTLAAAEEGIYEVAQVSPVSGGVELFFPAFQRPTMGIFTLVFGLVFVGAGVGVGYAEGPSFFAGIFTLVGTGIGLSGLYYLGKSLRVRIGLDGIRARRFLFSYPIATKSLEAAELGSVSIEQGATMQSGNKTTVYYNLKARGKAGQKFIVAERLTNRREAEHLKELFDSYLG